MNKNKSFNAYNDIEEEMIERAFDADEDLPMPEDYIMDDINDRSIDYLKSVQKQRSSIESKFYNKNTNIEYEFSLNVDNNYQFDEQYEKLNLSKSFVKSVNDEFLELQIYIQDNFDSSANLGIKFSFEEILNKYHLNKDSINQAEIPNDSVLLSLSPVLTNKLCIKLIAHFDKLMFTIKAVNQNKANIILLWIYFILIKLKTPLIDEDNSVLYNLNKHILGSLQHEGVICTQESDSSTYSKIIFSIISEIFGQKIMRKTL